MNHWGQKWEMLRVHGVYGLQLLPNILVWLFVYISACITLCLCVVSSGRALQGTPAAAIQIPVPFGVTVKTDFGTVLGMSLISRAYHCMLSAVYSMLICCLYVALILYESEKLYYIHPFNCPLSGTTWVSRY